MTQKMLTSLKKKKRLWGNSLRLQSIFSALTSDRYHETGDLEFMNWKINAYLFSREEILNSVWWILLIKFCVICYSAGYLWTTTQSQLTRLVKKHFSDKMKAWAKWITLKCCSERQQLESVSKTSDKKKTVFHQHVSVLKAQKLIFEIFLLSCDCLKIYNSVIH